MKNSTAIGWFLFHLTILLAPAQSSLSIDGKLPDAAVASESVGPVKLREVGVDQVIELLEHWTGKTYLRPQSLPATTLSLSLKKSVTKEQAIRATETLLNLNGIALSPLDEQFVKVVPLNAAKGEAPELLKGSVLQLPPSGRIASKLFKLNFLRVGEFLPQITGQLNSALGAPPSVFEKANAVLITDSIANLQRVELLLQQVDRAEANSITPQFYQLNFAKASDVAGKLKSLFTGALQAQLSTATSISADERTNQVIIFADPSQQPTFAALISKMDVRSGQDTRNEVIFLKHASAKDVATILSQLISGQNGAQKTQSGENRPVAPPPKANSTEALSLETVTQFSPLLSILPEERSNAIVASGTVDDLRLIHELIGKIDVLLAQVRIEVVIAEVTLSDNSTTGISELGLKIEGDKLTGVSASLPGVTVKDGVITRPGGDTPVTGSWDLAAQITMAATPRKTHANILSVPNIITTHNREGKIFVGEQRPVISSYLSDTSSTSTSGNAGSGYRSTINSKDIGIQLSVKPLIGNDGSVQLEIQQEVNDILGEVTIDGNPQPRIGRRSTESFVSVKSGEIIVLGGLQRTSLSTNTSRLGPVPIIGDLLGSRSKEKTRTDLIFFLRPTVLTNSANDNTPALRQVEQFPKDQRQATQQVLGLPTRK